jgi:hypothetical protein
MVRRIKRLVRRPIAETQYQRVKSQLPESIVRWSNRQAHWVDRDGCVTGGSAAFIELLDAGGRPNWAALLSSQPLRPFIWLGYRLVATNRGFLGNFSQVTVVDDDYDLVRHW